MGWLFRCQHRKEVRDFSLKKNNKDSLERHCRSCESHLRDGRAQYPPDDLPKRCRICGELKPASEFHVEKRRATGRSRCCKVCNKESLRKNQKRVMALGIYVPRMRKICPKCNKEKLAKGFSKVAVSSDGLAIHCKECIIIVNKQSWAKAKMRRVSEDTNKGPMG